MQGLDHVDGNELMTQGYAEWVKDMSQDPDTVLIRLLSRETEIPEQIIMDHLYKDGGEPRLVGQDKHGEDVILMMEPEEFHLLVEVMIRGKLGEVN